MTVGLLCVSNLVMLYAWYGHLRSLSGAPAWVAILVSDRVRRILRGRPRQPDRREDDDAGAAEDHAGGGHAARLHAVLGAGDAPARLVELPGGRGLHLRGGLLHLQGLTSEHAVC